MGLKPKQQDEIEDTVDDTFIWNRADEYKASWISYNLKDVSIANEADWPRMANTIRRKESTVLLPRMNAICRYIEK